MVGSICFSDKFLPRIRKAESNKKEIKAWSTGEKIEIKILLTQEENKKIEGILEKLGFKWVRSVEEETDFVFLLPNKLILKVRNYGNAEETAIIVSTEKPDSSRKSTVILFQNYKLRAENGGESIFNGINIEEPNLKIVAIQKEKRSYFERGNLQISHDTNVKGIKKEKEKKEIKLGDFLEVTVSPENKKELDTFLEELREKGIVPKIISQHYYQLTLEEDFKIRN
jgi:hypothetical protein